MRRISPANWDSVSKHEASQVALLAMIAALQITLEAKELIGTALREETIAVLDSARKDIQNCTTRASEMIKWLTDERYLNHVEMLSWINALSIDLKLSQQGLHIDQYPLPIDLLRLEEGRRLVMALDVCREQIKFY